MKLDLTGLENLSNPSAAPAGKPLELPLHKVIEDPDQPRVQFDEGALNELAASIKAVGRVKKPISVKPANADGNHVINDGARRRRASERAGMSTILAFVDEEHDTVDQVLANLLHEELTPREIGDALQREIDAKRTTQADICARTGQDKTWVSRHLRIANAPEAIRAISDRCPDFKALANLVGAYEQHPDATMEAVGSLDHITRADVDGLLARLRPRNPAKPAPVTENNTPPASKKTPQAVSGVRQGVGSQGAPKAPLTPIPAPSPFDHLYSQQNAGVPVADILSVLPGDAAGQLTKDLAVINKEGVASAGKEFSSEVVSRLLEGTFSVQHGEGFYRLIAFMQGGVDKKAIPASRLLESVLQVAATSIK